MNASDNFIQTISTYTTKELDAALRTLSAPNRNTALDGAKRNAIRREQDRRAAATK